MARRDRGVSSRPTTDIYLNVRQDVIAAVALSALLDRGLLLYDAYNGGESYRAYAQAAAQYPDSPMPYWGEALALGPNINEPLTQEHFERAQGALAQAVARIAKATPLQQALIGALAAQYAGRWEDADADAAAYRSAMAAVVKQFPASDEAAMLYAEALADGSQGRHWNADGKPATPEFASMVALIHIVLARNPQQVMANHLCIHAYDAALDRTTAVACAARLDAMTFEPAAEHLAHMPSHTWIETGAYAKAVASSERAYTLIVKLTADPSADSEHNLYASHDAYVGYTAAAMLGSLAAAQRWDVRLSNKGFLRALTLARFHRWNDLLAGPIDSKNFLQAQARALALVHLGRDREAETIASQFRSDLSDPTSILVLARLDEHAGKTQAAIRRLQLALLYEKANFEAEYLPFFPMGEALGALYLRGGQNANAEATFRDTLKRYPDDPRALFGLALTLDREGRTDDAAAVRARFTAQWADADTTLTIDDL
jgi:hypothetical protein